MDHFHRLVGDFTEGEAIALMHKAFDLGVPLFDAADTYGNELSEELIVFGGLSIWTWRLASGAGTSKGVSTRKALVLAWRPMSNDENLMTNDEIMTKAANISFRNCFALRHSLFVISKPICRNIHIGLMQLRD